MRGPSFLQEFDISLIFVTVSCPFIFDQEISANDKYTGIGNLALLSVVPKPHRMSLH